jgi:hypothetical protein
MSDPLAPVLAALRALPPTGDLRMAQAMEVADAYSHALARLPADRGEIEDAAALPFTKEAIRHALLMVLAALPVHRDSLRLAYIRLADWQPADPPVEPIDLRSVRSTRDPLAMASRLAASRAPAAERRRAAAVNERSRLVEELRRLGYG